MALQGTIDAFPLTDVLQLLASSSKSGRLLLDGDRGRSTLWIDQGAVTGADGARPAPSSAAVAVMELMRFADGSFEFHAATGDDLQPPVALDPVPLGACLEQATELLEEWERIEAVVPSMEHRVRLSDELVEDTVTLDRDAWALVASIIDRPTVATVVRRQELDEFAGCAALASLVARSLVVIDEPEPYLPELVVDLDASAAHQEDRASIGSEDVAAAGPGLSTDAAAEPLDFPDRFPIDDLLGGSTGDGQDPWSSIDEDGDDVRPFAAAQTFDPIDFDSLGGRDRSVPDATAEAWDDVVAASRGVLDADPDPSHAQVAEPGLRPPDDAADESTDEVLRQMSRLSPKAAEAIAAALSAPGVPEPAPAPVPEPAPTRREDDGPVTYLGSL
ncbi:MAG: DUF4388 domain-containing protein [Microthrixaceae bacterium]